MTDDLIESLAGGLRPIRRGAVAMRLTGALGAGALVSLIGVLTLLGPRPDMPQAVGSGMFWIKLLYTGAIAVAGMWVVERLSRPGAVADRRLPWLALPVLGIALLAVFQLGGASAALRRDLVMGNSAAVCPWSILATSVPVFAALTWAMRGLAPTHLRAAGAMAGLAAGGAGAAIYALHCPETGAPFVAIWYSLGVLAAGGMGALLGPRLLRW